MRILLMNNHLVEAGGTETWMLTMARELVRRKHEVTAFTFYVGKFAERMPCSVVSGVRANDYDLAIVNHQTCWKVARQLNAKRIFTSHSAYLDELEGYPDDAETVVCVSDEIRQKRGRGVVIHNGIDLTAYRPVYRINSRPERILYLGKSQASPAFDVIRQSFRDHTLTSIDPARDTAEQINENDVVIGYGRSALEGIACGRAVLSADCRDYMSDRCVGGGMVTRSNFRKLATHNFTGRNDPIIFSTNFNLMSRELVFYSDG